MIQRTPASKTRTMNIRKYSYFSKNQVEAISKLPNQELTILQKQNIRQSDIFLILKINKSCPSRYFTHLLISREVCGYFQNKGKDQVI